MGRKRASRDTWNYTLRKDRKVVKHGITNDPVRREQELRTEGLKFTSMMLDSTAVSEATARERELERVEAYQRSHKGKKPKYNK